MKTYSRKEVEVMLNAILHVSSDHSIHRKLGVNQAVLHTVAERLFNTWYEKENKNEYFITITPEEKPEVHPESVKKINRFYQHVVESYQG